jgi:hypothetical protein
VDFGYDAGCRKALAFMLFLKNIGIAIWEQDSGEKLRSNPSSETSALENLPEHIRMMYLSESRYACQFLASEIDTA